MPTKILTLLPAACLLFLHSATAQTNKLEPTGNAGIGTTTPTEKLEIVAEGPAVVQLKNSMDIMGGVGTLKFNMAGTELGRIETERVVPEGRLSVMKFHVLSSAGLIEGMRINNSGYVGIGTATPAQKLDVSGYILSAYSPVEGGLYLGNSNHGIKRWAATNDVELFTTEGNLYLSANGTNGKQMTIKQSGDVELGTQTQTATLVVNGPVTSKRVKVTQNVWADYVFHPSYQLPGLDAVETHIRQKHHLPGIPSAKEVQQHGLDLGDMQKKQMQKIEELTLYLIDMHKKVTAQQNLINEQTKKLEELEKRLHAAKIR